MTLPLASIAIAAALAGATLAGCGGRNSPSEQNFAAAMDQYFEQRGEQCLNTERWPVDVTDMDMRMKDTIQTSKARRMAALEAVGLVAGRTESVEAVDMFGRPNGKTGSVRRYTLTEEAGPYIREEVVKAGDAGGDSEIALRDLCWGRKILDKIILWEGPMKFGDYQEARVSYTYKLEDVADWARRPELQSAFPGVGRTLDGAGHREARHTISLTSEGWRARGLD